MLSLSVNDRKLPTDLIRFAEVRRKRYQFFFSSELASPEEVQQERQKEEEIESKAEQVVKENVRLTNSELLETIGINGRCYHLLPWGCGGTMCPTPKQLVRAFICSSKIIRNCSVCAKMKIS